MKKNRKLVLSSLVVLSLGACTQQNETSAERAVVEKTTQAIESVTSETLETAETVIVENVEEFKVAVGEKLESVAELSENAAELVVDQAPLENSVLDTVVNSAVVEEAVSETDTVAAQTKMAAKDATPLPVIDSVVEQKAAIVSPNDSPVAEPAALVEQTPAFVPLNGSWVKKSQSIQGQWQIVQREGTAFLVLSDDFKTRKAPDLKFVLSKLSVDEVNNKNAMQGAKLISLLESVKGSQSYRLPDDYTSYKSLLLHCEKYTKLWGAASLK